MAFVPQFESDIYISYAFVDNSHPAKTEGWVDVFHTRLDVELSKVIGRRGIIQIGRRDYERFYPTIRGTIKGSAIFLPLISYAYLKSEFCRTELKIFHDAAQSSYGVRVNDCPRILPVYLQDVKVGRPAEIVRHQIFGHPFYDEDHKDRPCDPTGETFQKRISLLVRYIVDTLQILSDVSPKQSNASERTPTKPIEIPAPPPPKATEPVTSAKSAVFISYRRGEGTPYAGRLYDQLVAQFGEDRVFMDLDAIEPGDDFVEVITNYVSSCSILIALIHKSWLDAKDEEGRRRLHNPDDFVNIEISTALQRNIRVIPVLVQGASMPRHQDLPESLSILSRRNALELSDTRWRSDVSKLIKVLEKHL